MPEIEKHNGIDTTKDLKSPMMPQVEELTETIANLDGSLTHLKKLNTVIKEVQALMDTVADKSREGVVLFQDNKFVWVNKAACVISGYTFDEMLALSVPDITLPSHRDKLMARINMLLAGDPIPTPQEWPVYRKDRMVRYVRIFSYRVIYREKPAILSIYYDITESKKILDESVMRAQILDSINDHVILVDMSGRIAYVNDAVCDSMGYAKDELINSDVLELIAPDLRKKFNIRMKQISEHKEARYKTILIRKDNSRIHIEVRAKIIRQGGKQFVLGVARENPEDDIGMESV
ncbi:MAG: PAS domain S-box protein [Dehalococcoidia bacterium]|jgi:PAS domain S-box-containing protein